MINLWLNCQTAGDYNPTHTHGGSFSGVIFLKVPPQINANSFDGQLCFHGPEDWHIQSFRTGMAHYVLPVPGEFYVCLLYTSPSPRDRTRSRMPSSA